MADAREIKGVGRSPASLFAEERPALGPLPALRWQQVGIAVATVQEAWRIQYDCAYYSVPYRYIGKRVTVLAVNEEVIGFLDGEELTRHRRAAQPWQTVRNPLHAPPEPEAYMSETRERLLERAAAIGASTLGVAEEIFSRQAVDGMRPVRALLALAKSCGRERLEAACLRARLFESGSYGCVKRILERNLDAVPLSEPVHAPGRREFRFTRERQYFSSQAPFGYLEEAAP